MWVCVTAAGIEYPERADPAQLTRGCGCGVVGREGGSDRSKFEVSQAAAAGVEYPERADPRRRAEEYLARNNILALFQHVSPLHPEP